MAAVSQIITLKIEQAPQTTALLNEVLSAACESLPESVLQVFESVFDRSEAIQQLFSVKSDFGAAGAVQGVVRLYPGNGLVLLVAAIRAWKGESLVIEDIHGFAPFGCLNGGCVATPSYQQPEGAPVTAECAGGGA